MKDGYTTNSHYNVGLYISFFFGGGGGGGAWGWDNVHFERGGESAIAHLLMFEGNELYAE